MTKAVSEVILDYSLRAFDAELQGRKDDSLVSLSLQDLKVLLCAARASCQDAAHEFGVLIQDRASWQDATLPWEVSRVPEC